MEWLGTGLDNTRYQPEPAIRATDVAKLALKWAFGYPSGTEFGQPTVVDGALFLTSSAGRIYSLDAKPAAPIGPMTPLRAAARRSTSANSPAREWPRCRSKLKRTLAHLDVIKAPSAAFFGDDTGAVYALDAQKGTLLWKTQVDTIPWRASWARRRCTTTGCTWRVSSTEDNAAANPELQLLHLSRQRRGARHRQRQDRVEELYRAGRAAATRKNSAGVQEFGPAGAAISSSPDHRSQAQRAVRRHRRFRDRVRAVADRCRRRLRSERRQAALGQATQSTGGGHASERLLQVPRYCGPWRPAIKSYGRTNIGRRLRTRSRITAAKFCGRRKWRRRSVRRRQAARARARDAGGGVAWGGAADHRNLYVATSGLLAQPVNSSGSLTALDIEDRQRPLAYAVARNRLAPGAHDCWHAQAQAVTVMPGSAFSGSMDGHLRAYSTIDGKILWDFDTAKDFKPRTA